MTSRVKLHGAHFSRIYTCLINTKCMLLYECFDFMMHIFLCYSGTIYITAKITLGTIFISWIIKVIVGIQHNEGICSYQLKWSHYADLYFSNEYHWEINPRLNIIWLIKISVLITSMNYVMLLYFFPNYSV